MATVRTSNKRKKESSAASRPERDDKYFSKVVGKALDLLDLIKKSSKPLTLNELTNHVGMAKSSVFRILHTLEVAGYIRKDEAGQYMLSAQVRPWVSRYFVDELVRLATPRMWELRRTFGETVSLGVMLDNHIEVVAVVESGQLIRMGNTIGRIIPPHASSIGKSIAAFQSDTRRENLLRSYGLHRLTDSTITDELELRRELEQIREQGWATDREESTPSGYCFGVPLRVGDEILAAMSISVPERRRPDDAQSAEIIEALKKASREITEELREQSPLQTGS